MFGIRKEETASYKTLIQEDKLELREYRDFIIAKIKVQQSFEKSGNAGFRPLANYIFGGNQNNQKIKMTAPVGVSSETENDPHNLREKSSWTVSFMMPSEYELEALPKPDNAEVSHQKVSAGLFAVIKYSGSTGKEKFEKKLLLLKSWMQKEGLKQSESFWFWRYDPPWTIPALKRNEIAIRVLNKEQKP